jgi:hypothetical protein
MAHGVPHDDLCPLLIRQTQDLSAGSSSHRRGKRAQRTKRTTTPAQERTRQEPDSAGLTMASCERGSSSEVKPGRAERERTSSRRSARAAVTI